MDMNEVLGQLAETSIQAALDCYGAGNRAAAEQMLGTLVQIAPDLPRAHAALGFFLTAEQRHAEAADRFQVCCRLEPQEVDWWIMRGRLLIVLGDWTRSAGCFEKAIELVSDDGALFREAGYAQFRAGNLDHAAILTHRAAQLEPDSFRNFYLLGMYLLHLGTADDAVVECLSAAIRLAPESDDPVPAIIHDLCSFRSSHLVARILELLPPRDDLPADYYLAMATYYQGQANPEDAIKNLEKALELDSTLNREMLTYQIALVRSEGTGVVEIASDPPAGIIQQLFSKRASEFDHRRLSHEYYRSPGLIGLEVSAISERHGKPARALDVGCGTGLVGMAVSAHCGELVGIDLSAEMLVQAEQKEVYSRLVHGDFLRQDALVEPGFQLVTAAGITECVYDLEGFFGRCRTLLVEGGHLVFAFELPFEADVDTGFEHDGTLRHAPERVRAALDASGFEIESMEPNLLRFPGHVVSGGYVTVARRAG